MARISASIPEDLKDELYQAATDTGMPISHINVEALRSHLKSPDLGSKGGGGQAIDTSRLESQISGLSAQIHELQEQMVSRTPPKGVRFF